MVYLMTYIFAQIVFLSVSFSPLNALLLLLAFAMEKCPHPSALVFLSIPLFKCILMV